MICQRVALLGGVYSNYLALRSALDDARRRGVDQVFCLGDVGAFGPFPDRVFPLLHQYAVRCLQGNYDHSIGNQLDDCQCGYTDPRDNHFARISYQYTRANTSPSNQCFLRDLPPQIRLKMGGRQILLCHGSPRRTNEFLWESTSSTHFLQHLCQQHGCDVIACTHTGIKWTRQLPGNRLFANVGVLGRPENDGTTNVWYAILEHRPDGQFALQFVPITYDHRRLAREMREEGLPEEFCETVVTGWWTTCLEILPFKERKRARF